MKRIRTGISVLSALFISAILGGVCAAERVEADLSGLGWKVWHDAAAEWKSDALFLPPTDLAKIPANPPTGGWQAVNAGKATRPSKSNSPMQAARGFGAACRARHRAGRQF
ncbi:MAG TPA: hypothetical protein VHM90_14965 [Phycisphaerae bacterium]|jgi:hypothetical protein|nr:hypothetical protein [Phycisphaerae bacterium]